MKHYTEEVQAVSALEAVTCDSCKIRYDDIFDLQEFLFLDFVGGYSSVFGDENRVQADLCQNCVKSILIQFLRITPRVIELDIAPETTAPE